MGISNSADCWIGGATTAMHVVGATNTPEGMNLIIQVPTENTNAIPPDTSTPEVKHTTHDSINGGDLITLEHESVSEEPRNLTVEGEGQGFTRTRSGRRVRTNEP